MKRLRDFDNLRLYDLTDEDDAKEVYQILTGPNPAHETIRRYAQRLWKIIHSGGTLTVLCEDEYYDEDHMRCHQKRYARSIRQPRALCERLHFFWKQLTVRKLNHTLGKRKRVDPHGLAEELGYFGFIVVRDDFDLPIGRIMLADKLVKRAYDTYYTTTSQQVKIHLSSRVPAHVSICGVQLNFHTIPAMTADIETGVCASAAAWVVLRVLNRKEVLAPWYSMVEITEIANKTLTVGHVMPSGGLNMPQILNLFREARLDPFFRGVGFFDLSFAGTPSSHTLAYYWRTVLYSLQESGTPVLLHVRCGKVPHAIALVGHTFTPKGDTVAPLTRSAMNGDQTYRSVSDCTVDFILHDSFQGPYELAKLEIKAGPEGHAWLTFVLQFPFGPVDANIRELQIEALAIPLPEDVSIDADNAEQRALTFFTDVAEGVPSSADVVFRTFLIRNNDFYAYLADAQTGVHSEILIAFRRLRLPKWIYVTQLRHKNTDTGLIDGQIVIDATTSWFNTSVLAMQYHRVLLVQACDPASKGAKTNRPTFAPCELGPDAESPYGALEWHC